MRWGDNRGFSLPELLVAALIGLVLAGGAMVILQRSIHVSDLAGALGEVHQNGRVAVNLVSRDLSMAGTGIPHGGIQLPSGAGSSRSRFACDTLRCYVPANTYDDNRLYSITPGNGKGPEINGAATDVVTTVFRDWDSHFDQYPLVHITPSGNQITFDSRTVPPVSDPVDGINPGDILILSNANGSAAGVVTGVNGNQVLFANNDPLNFNQPSAAFGNIASLANPGTPAGQYPPTRAFRVNVVTYFLDPAPSGDTVRLMRQVNANPPAAVAESIQDLQLTYDIFEETGGTAADLPSAGGTPNQIRKVNVVVLARSLRPELGGGRYEHIALRTAVSARNLAFRDRYE